MADTWVATIKTWAAAVLASSDMNQEIRDRATVLANAVDGDTSGTTIKHRHKSGTLAARPTAGEAGRLYYATDLGAEFIDDGSAWLIKSVVKEIAEHLYDDFILNLKTGDGNNTGPSQADWASSFAGTGTWTTADSFRSILGLHTNATASSRSAIMSRDGGAEHYAVHADGVPSILGGALAISSGASTNQRLYFGLMEVGLPNVNNEPANGIYFRKIDTGSEVDWEAVVRSSSTDRLATGITGLQDGDKHKFRIEIKATDDIEFFVDGISEATYSGADAPTANLAIACFIDNQTTLNKIIDLDYIEWVTKRRA